MSKRISVENYRVFREMTDFNIRPLTLLIGPNNSGKSSFTKLLLLLKNGISQLKFKEGEHNLKGFDEVLSWNAENKILKLRLPNSIDWLSDDFYVEISIGNVSAYSSSLIIGRVILKNDEDEILLNLRIPVLTKEGKKSSSVQLMNAIGRNDDSYNSEYSQIMYINIKLFIDLIYSYSLTYPDGLHGKQNIIKALDNKKGKITTINFSTAHIFNDYNYWEGNLLKDNEALILYNEINSLENDYLLYNVIINGKDITKAYQLDIINVQTSSFGNIDISKFLEEIDGSPFFDEDLPRIIKEIIPKINLIVKKELVEHFKMILNLVNDETINIEETKLGKLLFASHKLPSFGPDTISYDYNFFNKLRVLFDDKLFSDLNYISTNRGSQKQILLDYENREINELFANYFKKADSIDYKEYFDKVLNIFSIDGSIVVERFQDVVSAVFIQFNDTNKGVNGKVPLSELGFGFSQLLPIMLKIIDTKGNNKNYILGENNEYIKKATIIIEEPEANLHPMLQSKLADFFVLTLKYYPNLNLIIETHSEYLIRKLQLLIATKEFKSENLMIHYFNSDDTVNVNNPKVKQIEIDEDGQLSDSFGVGFYDEASELKYKLMIQDAKSKLN